MATQILSQDVKDKNITSVKLEDNISIVQSLTVGTTGAIGTDLLVGSNLGVIGLGTIGTSLVVGTDLFVGSSVQNATNTLALLSGVLSGPGIIGLDFNSLNLINEVGSLLLRLRNVNSQVFGIDGYGNVISAGGIIEGTDEALKFKDAYTGSAIPFSDTTNFALPPGRASLLDAIANAGTVTDLTSAYNGEAGSGAGRTLIADAGPVSIQRNSAGSDDPLLEIGDGYTLNKLELLADGSIVGGSSPFVFRSRESDTIAGSAFQLEATENLGPGADLLRLVNDSLGTPADVLQIKAGGNLEFGPDLAPRFTAAPPITGGDDTAFTFATTAPDFDDSILKLEHSGGEKFAFDGYGNLSFKSGELEIGTRDGYARFFSSLSEMIFRNSVGEFMAASGANLKISSPLSNQNEIILDGSGGNKITFISGVVDGPAAEGFEFDTRNDLLSPGSKLTTWKSTGSEVASIDGYGNATFRSVESQSGLISSPSVLSFRDANAVGLVPFSDASNTELPFGVTSILGGLAQAASLANLSILDSYTVTVDITVPAAQNFVVITNALALPLDPAADSNGSEDGAVAALNSIMGVHSTVNNSLNNKAVIRDASTNDPIFDGYGQEIFGLLHAETSVEGSFFSTSASDRLQISFVTTNPISEVVQPADVSSIENKVIEYTYNRRVKLADATESALSGGLMLNSIPDSLDNSYDGYEEAGSGRHVYADAGAMHIIVPDGYTNDALEITKSDPGDGYGIKINSNSDVPAIYIDQVAGPSITFAKDNQNDIGRFQANRPRSIYAGTQVVIGDSIKINTDTVRATSGLTTITESGNMEFKSPGSNVVDGMETPSFGIEITGERTVVSPYEKPLFSITNFDRTVLRVDGYGSAFLGDSSDAYGLDASRIVFNANMHGVATLPDDADDAGLFVDRGANALPAKLFWDEGNDTWKGDNGDGIERNVFPIAKNAEQFQQVVCQDDESLSINLKDTWARGLVHRVIINTTSPDYDFEIHDSYTFDNPRFRVAHASGNLDADTSFFYEEKDGLDELHYRIINHDEVAHFFDSYVRAEVFFEGVSRGSFIETFDGGAFCAPIFGILFSEDFGTGFDVPVGTPLFGEDFDAGFTIPAGSLLLTEDFDSYGAFDAYAGFVLDSDDMNTLGF